MRMLKTTAESAPNHCPLIGDHDDDGEDDGESDGGGESDSGGGGEDDDEDTEDYSTENAPSSPYCRS